MLIATWMMMTTEEKNAHTHKENQTDTDKKSLMQTYLSKLIVRAMRLLKNVK